MHLHAFSYPFDCGCINFQLRVGLQSLIVELDDKGFFCIADDATDSVIVPSMNSL
jgi:hypothetical protein